jgi:D-glycero-alpha-D-manno-heptose 1-phosphate guanylyltransferase
MATAFSPADARAAPSRPLQGIDCVLLAGGLGSRLRPALQGRQKVFAEVAGRPFLCHLIDFYAAAGAERIVLALGYRATDGEQLIRDFRGKAELIASIEPELRGTGGALRHALPLLRTQTLLVANGDSLAQIDIGALLRLHRERAGSITLALARRDDTSRYGSVLIDDAGAVIQFREKAPVEPDAPKATGFINAGIYLIERRVIAAMPPDRPLSLEREVFPQWVGRGLFGLASGMPFIDIGTPESWAAAAHFFASLARRGGPGGPEGLP